MTLDGDVVIVTGGSRGIGRACVLAAAARGARVVFCSRSDEAHRALEAEAAAQGGAGQAVGLRLDVSREEDVATLFAQAAQRFGPVTSVVSNAAVSRAALLVTLPSEDWDQVIATNLTGGFLVARAAVRTFLTQRSRGRVVSIGTISQNGAVGNSAYAASKGGLLGLTRALASGYASRGIIANLVVPGYVETALSSTLLAHDRRRLVEGCPLRRPGSPDEIASVVMFLLEGGGAGLNGQALFVSGGLLETPP